MPKAPKTKSSGSKKTTSEYTKSEAQLAYIEEMTKELKVSKPNQKGKSRVKEISAAWKKHPSNPKAK
ncbi:hypothetical protein JCM5350_000193 [Sporobolomyces pararoseus]